MPSSDDVTSDVDAPADFDLPRVVIAYVKPCLDAGEHAAKCALGHMMHVQAAVICDGHDFLKADLLYRRRGEEEWQHTPMKSLGNDLYEGDFTPEALGYWEYKVKAAIDRFTSWRDGLIKKLEAGECTPIDGEIGLPIFEGMIKACNRSPDRRHIEHVNSELELLIGDFGDASKEVIDKTRALLLDPEVARINHDLWTASETVESGTPLPLFVDPARAAFSAWYEFFPRSRWEEIAPDGNLKDCLPRLEYAAKLGFDVVYLPPIHPIGETFRKGKNNALHAEPGDVGCPWAIGSKHGGHKAIHPDLGDFKDFAALVDKAKELDIQIALDIALQCSPDHPYVRSNPEWFVHRPDGTIQYAENPPKKYQDIYPLNFECAAQEDREALWEELKSIFTFWIGKGVTIFRVDNPHTKSFRFWSWLIEDLRREHPEVILLAEAFTRPHIMAHLAAIGFNQSYTYFAWRNAREELDQYMTELTKGDLQGYYRPNFWPNTPDIYTDALQYNGRAGYIQRFILAATLTANYGIYGPCFELMEGIPLKRGREDYLDSEKYEIQTWDVRQRHSLGTMIRKINEIRKKHPALQQNRTYMHHSVDNPKMYAYSKTDPSGTDIILTVVNLDPWQTQTGTIDLQIQELGLRPDLPYQVHDLLTGKLFEWRGWRNIVSLDPRDIPAHIFHITQHVPETGM